MITSVGLKQTHLPIQIIQHAFMTSITVRTCFLFAKKNHRWQLAIAQLAKGRVSQVSVVLVT